MSTREPEKPKGPTIAVDFDGVIHAYRHGWRDGSIYDEPLEGAGAWIDRMLDRGWTVVIYSSRLPKQAEEVATWLAKHGIRNSRLHLEPGKPKCHAFIDDRAVRFVSWPQAVEEVEEILMSRGEIPSTE